MPSHKMGAGFQNDTCLPLVAGFHNIGANLVPRYLGTYCATVSSYQLRRVNQKTYTTPPNARDDPPKLTLLCFFSNL